jgi:N-acetylglucosaminyl-diphospho-decaprenol L-rhamnosyltransferase
MNDEPLTLFVVHWNQPDECIATIRRFLNQEIPLNIVVLDNASAPEARDYLSAELAAEGEITALEENKGWGPALNIGLTKWLAGSRGSYCLISAHDAEPSDDCARLLVQAMEGDSQIGIACPQYPDATVPHFSCLRGVWQERETPLPSGTTQLVDVPHGTLFLVRRECLAEIGLFDERYFAYGDEHELGLRAGCRGWKIVLVWGAVVINRGTWTPSPWRSYLFTRNSLLLVHDYCGKLSASIRAGLILLNTIRLAIFSPGEGFAFSPKARWRGVCDYFRARYGRPSVGVE